MIPICARLKTKEMGKMYKGKVKETYGSIVRQFRQNRGLTQKDLAKLSGVPYQEISQIENGKQYPAAGAVDKINEVLDITILETLTEPEQWSPELQIMLNHALEELFKE